MVETLEHRSSWLSEPGVDGRARMLTIASFFWSSPLEKDRRSERSPTEIPQRSSHFGTTKLLLKRGTSSFLFVEGPTASTATPSVQTKVEEVERRNTWLRVNKPVEEMSIAESGLEEHSERGTKISVGCCSAAPKPFEAEPWTESISRSHRLSKDSPSC